MIEAGADVIHVGVMDMHYVPNLTFGPRMVKALRKRRGVPIGLFADAGADIISLHPQASERVDRFLSVIRQRDCRAGLVLNLATTLSVVGHVMHRLDLILLMSVNPGFGGQAFIAETLRKAKAVRARIGAHTAETGKSIWREIGGGVKVDNIAEVAESGVDTFGNGSAVLGAPDADGSCKSIVADFGRELDAVHAETGVA